LLITFVAFICNFLFISHYGKNLKEDIFVDRVALDMAFKDLTKTFLKKEKGDSPNSNSQG
jgi:hypothetical protein